MMPQSVPHGRRRDKPILSYFVCDRQSPCSSCLRHGRTKECKYSSSEQECKDARVSRLEKLVTQMRDQMRVMEQNSRQASGIPVSSSLEPFLESASRLTPFFSQIRILKDELSDGHSEAGRITRISLLSGHPSLPKEQILAMIPHARFLAEYSKFWVDTTAAPIMWVGLLVSVMSVSAFLQQQDNGAFNIGNWILIGVIAQLALCMGLPHNPSHWPNIRPLEAEFRRRLWITLYYINSFTSTQLGLPHIYHQGFSITAAKIYDVAEAGPPSFAVIAILDAKLERAIDSIPGQSKCRSLETSIMGSPATTLNRIFIDILMRENAKSSKLCINAALVILEQQQTISEEAQPGYIIFGIRWGVASSLNHEFQQVTMILCFALTQFHGSHLDPIESGVLYRWDEILEDLDIAKCLWENDADRSIVARRAATATTSALKQDFDKVNAGAVQCYFGDHDAGPNMMVDPPCSVVDADMVAFGSSWDDFIAEPIEGDWTGMN
ncbi:hypothetical protein BDV23DRAFT_174063 [Aspergillus alliaceus]|uniref:Xylanolytic transcriptional activator regulatory domain-containing protein n=1 Tax=Petromyces alliaceus TaxID=209559 RepID=A0A5N7C2C2_PETAA|nr:hypothetical protein BDV23DRAFT_174063 [Aspergillus alliaceus]